MPLGLAARSQVSGSTERCYLACAHLHSLIPRQSADSLSGWPCPVVIPPLLVDQRLDMCHLKGASPWPVHFCFVIFLDSLTGFLPDYQSDAPISDTLCDD